jgi:hypothetical protein
MSTEVHHLFYDFIKFYFVFEIAQRNVLRLWVERASLAQW